MVTNRNQYVYDTIKAILTSITQFEFVNSVANWNILTDGEKPRVMVIFEQDDKPPFIDESTYDVIYNYTTSFSIILGFSYNNDVTDLNLQNQDTFIYTDLIENAFINQTLPLQDNDANFNYIIDDLTTNKVYYLPNTNNTSSFILINGISNLRKIKRG